MLFLYLYEIYFFSVLEPFIVSARKYRPQTFKDVVGQSSITNTLLNAIENNHLAQALLFCGPRGVGKTTVARILAANLNKVQDLASSIDIIELDGASNRGIDEIREIRELCKDSSNFQNVLKTMPTRMDLERILLQELVNNNDPVRALRKLPITIRRLLVQSYQSYLFNRSLSKVIKEGYDIALPRSGDVCFRFSNNSVVGIKKFDYTTSVIQLPAIPLVGYAFKDDNRFSSILKSIMEEENISKNDFYIKEINNA